MPRQFKLINAKGLSWDLMDRTALLYLPNGMGFRMSSKYMKIGAAYQLISTEAEQKVISGEMVFSGYQRYRDFADFIVSTPLKLAYMPQNEWAYLDCEVSRLDKGEIDYRDLKLKCAVDFTATSKWYIPRNAQRSGISVANAKQYTYSYTYTYADSITGIIDIINNSSEDSPAVITILGQITNPTWSLIVNNAIRASGSVSGTIDTGEKLVINSKDNQLEIAVYEATTNEWLRNVYQDSDFNRENFIYVPPGNSTLQVSGSVSDSIDAWAEIEEIHETI